MGCISTKESVQNNTEGEDEKLDMIKQQRRRLSVTPALVGDVNGKRPNGQVADSPVAANVSTTPVDIATTEGETYVAMSKKGFVPYNKKKRNQDCYLLKEGLNGEEGFNMYGVCDGHGEFGHLVSGFVKQNIVKYLEKQNNLKDDTAKAMKNAIQELCDELETADINIAFSGTTCVFSLFIGNKVFCANIGDSRCIVVCEKENGFQAIPLSRDQKPDDPDEKARIIRAGGRVEPLPGPPTEDLGPSRVWLAEVDVPGLAMSRSIGDEISHTVGVISEPEVKEYEITGKELFYAWGSDGVWEFLSNEEVAELVKSAENREKARADVVEASTQKWQEVEEVIDDITVVIKWPAQAAK